MKLSRSKFEYIEQKWFVKNIRFKISEDKYIFIYSLKQFLHAIYRFGMALLMLPFQIILAVLEIIWEIIECIPICFKDLCGKALGIIPFKYIKVVDDEVKKHTKGQYCFDKVDMEEIE